MSGLDGTRRALGGPETKGQPLLLPFVLPGISCSGGGSGRWHLQWASRPPRQLNTVRGLSSGEGVSSSKRGIPRPPEAGPSAKPRGWASAAPPLRSPSVHVGADRAGDAERLCGDGDVLVVHRTVVVRGDVRVEERHLHGAQASRCARAQAARVETQQHVQFVLDGLHLGAERGWRRGLGPGRGEAGGGAWEARG